MPSTGRQIVGRLQIHWRGEGTALDETANLISASGSMRLAPPGVALLAGKGMVDQATFSLHNTGGRYSSFMTTAALYNRTQEGKSYQSPVYFDISTNGGGSYTRVFTGIIKIPTEAAKTGKTPPTITIDARSKEDTILQRKISTTQANFKADYLSGKTESDHIATWLQAAGLTSGDYELDTGLFVIPWGWLDDESPVEAAWNLAAACGGRFYIRHSDGKFIYENMQRWAKTATSAATYTSADMTGMEIRYPDQNLYKTVAVEVGDRAIGATETIWKLDNPITVPASESRSLVAELSAPVDEVSAPTYAASTSGGINITGNLSVSVTNYAQRLAITLTNSNSTQAAIVKKLEFTGKKVEADNGQVRSATSSDTFWSAVAERRRDIRGNRFIQSEAQASVLTNWLRDAQDTPLPVFTLQNVRGEPRAAGDFVSVGNQDITFYGQECFVVANNWRYSRAGYWQNLELVQRAGLFAYITTTPGYFVVGTNKLGSSDPARGRVLY